MIYEIMSEIVVYHVYFFNIIRCKRMGSKKLGGSRRMTNGGTFVEICEKIIVASVCVCKYLG